ncbi:MAG: hypothetical protein ACTSU4_13455 [Promethearchaeota archaeon]
MKELIEVGLVFRGFVLVNHVFKTINKKKGKEQSVDDLRGAFISAISSFIEVAFTDNSLEYLESGNFLFIFKVDHVKSLDSNEKEPIILFGLVDKSKKNPDKLVKKFLGKADPILQAFITRYNNVDFSEIEQFQPFKDILKRFFL